MFPFACRYDVVSLFLLGSINAAMNLFGDLHEVMNAGKRRKNVDWMPFLYGCFAGVVPWIAVWTYAGGSPSASSIPSFVWAILGCYMVLFATFPVNMILQYCSVGWWCDHKYPDLPNGGYLFGEKVYQVLSLVAKSLLLWLVIGGVNQPNPYTT
jgi:Heliorhodopsin